MKEDWIECTLGEVTQIYAGVGFPKNKQGKRTGQIPFFKVGDISRNVQSGNRYLKFCDNYIDIGDIPKIENKLLPKNTITFAKIGEALKLNRRCITEQNSLVDNNAIGVKADKHISDLFLYFFFLRIQLEKYSRATTVPSVRKTDIENIPFPLPPLPIQKAIVKKIEELFSSLDSGIADLKKAQNQLVIYRQAVLKKAFDLNLKGHKIQEICKEIFAGGDKPKDFFSKTKTKKLSIPILANAVANNGLYGYTKTARVNELAITIAGRGSGTGHVELRDEPFVPIVRLITLIPNLEKVVPKYLMYFLKNLNIKGTGSAIPQLTIPTVKSYVINLPSLEKQNQIIQEIESRLSVCDKVEKDIALAIERSRNLRQSILKKAFEGKLLSEEEIAACKQHPDYEPGSVLLEKIKAEKKK